MEVDIIAFKVLFHFILITTLWIMYYYLICNSREAGLIRFHGLSKTIIFVHYQYFKTHFLILKVLPFPHIKLLVWLVLGIVTTS